MRAFIFITGAALIASATAPLAQLLGIALVVFASLGGLRV